MLEQADPDAGQWLTAPLSQPFGRGINLQIEVVAVGPIIQKNLVRLDFHSIENAKTLRG